MSSAVSTTDTGLDEALGSLQFVSPDIASLRTCTRTKSSIVRSHLGRFAYGKRMVSAFTQCMQTRAIPHDLIIREAQMNGMLILPIFSIRKMAAQAPPDVT